MRRGERKEEGTTDGKEGRVRLEDGLAIMKTVGGAEMTRQEADREAKEEADKRKDG